MKVVLAALADSAKAQDDGKINILGSGLDVIYADSFPFVQVGLALVLKVQFAPSECNKRYQVEIRALREDGKEFLPLFVLAVVPRPNTERPELPVSLPFVRNLRDLRFDQPGRYRFEVLVSKELLASLELQAVLANESESEGATLRDVLQVSLTTGYEAFVSGDLDRAGSILSTVVEEFPHSADAQNNFGFILLARGEALEALEAFRRADDAGFALPELLRANVACCLYIAKQYRSAFEMFRNLISARFLSESAVLFALGTTSRSAIQLYSPADYLALMALNASRSALAAGFLKEAGEFSAIATTGHLSFSQKEDSGPIFERYLSELTNDLENAGLRNPTLQSEGGA